MPLPFWTNFALTRFGEEAGLLSITGGNKQTNKENRRNPNEQEAGNKAEVGGFHDLRWLLGEAITCRPNYFINVRARHRA